jgi:ketosteroid isomerase-like protein
VLDCVTEDSVVQASGDAAVLTHRVGTTVATNEGESVLRERETIVFAKRDGRWLGVHEHLSPDPSA